MQVTLKCKICNSDFSIPHWRINTAKYCSRKCSDISRKGKENAICDYCDKKFHIKESSLKKYKRSFGVFCSRDCLNNVRKIKFTGEGNHQYGLKGDLNSSFKGKEILRKNNTILDIHVYSPTHPFKNNQGRVLKHRLLVEENFILFNINNFIVINNRYYLKKELHVHHIDGNHDNNNLDNLQIVTKSQHRILHNKEKKIIRDDKGRIIGVIKFCELLEKPEEANQQPS